MNSTTTKTKNKNKQKQTNTTRQNETMGSLCTPFVKKQKHF